MTKNLDEKKYQLIQEIIKIEKETLLLKIEHDIKEAQKQTEIWSKIISPVKKTITLEEMTREQNYKPITKEEFFKLTADLNIEESLEDLLAQLNLVVSS